MGLAHVSMAYARVSWGLYNVQGFTLYTTMQGATMALRSPCTNKHVADCLQYSCVQPLLVHAAA